MAPGYYDLRNRLQHEEERLFRVEDQIAVAQDDLRMFQIEADEANDQADRLESIIRQFRSSQGRRELEMKLSKAETKYGISKEGAYRARNRLDRLEEYAEDLRRRSDWLYADLARAERKFQFERERAARYEGWKWETREAKVSHAEGIPSWPQSGARRTQSRYEERIPSWAQNDAKPAAEAEPISILSIKQWRDQTDACFTDYSAIKEFPEPPGGACSNCQAKGGSRCLKACECNIEAAFIKLGANLKTERLRWHPDKFACSGFEGKAQEVFVVLNGMYQKERGRVVG